MTISDETLMAYMDGELSDAEMGEIEQQIETDAGLLARLERLQSADAFLVEKYGAVDAKPIRQDTLDLIAAHSTGESEVEITEPAAEDISNVVSFKPKQTQQAEAVRSGWWPQAIAASVALFIGFGAGTQYDTGTVEEDVDVYGYETAGVIAPSSPLYDVLENSPSLQETNVGGDTSLVAQPLMSFRSRTGSYCREFSVTAPQAASKNVACRGDEIWLIKATVTTAAMESAAGGFIPASGTEASLVDAMILELMEGDALGPEDETALINSSWHK